MARRSLGVLIATWSLAATAVAQPGAGLGTGGSLATNSATGATDTLGANALDMQFNMMATMLQQQTFLLMGAALADPKVRQQIAEEQRKAQERLATYAERGRDVIARGAATTTFAPVADPERERRIASAFGPQALQQALVAKNLAIYASFVRARGLARNDVADVIAIGVALGYQVARDLPSWDAAPGALEELRKVARRRVLEDAEFQGMPDADRQTLHDFLAVWLVALVADYQQARQITFTDMPLEAVRERASRAVPALIGAEVEQLRFTERSFAIEN
jgi:hypothetical protein